MAESSPTFSESWYRIANQRIALRPGIQVRRQSFRGERWIVIENPLSNQFYRLRPEAYEFVARLRPDKTVEEVWRECLARFPDTAPGQESVIQLLSQLYFANLLQYNLASDSAQLFERHKRTRQRDLKSKFLNVMFMRFPLLDPDQFLVRTLPLVGRLISPFGALLWLAMVGFGLKVAIDHFPQLKDQSQGVLAPGNLFLLYAGLVFVKTVHEFGHAYFCRRFGGEVHVMGVMLMIFTPIPYMDATSSWGFRNRWHRVLVGAAGMIVELFVASIAAVIWANTGPGNLHNLAYNIMFVASVSTLVFNVNPLLRYDGYYILSDLLEIPNLSQQANKQLRYWVERYAFGVRRSEPATERRREKVWLTTYGITSGIYRVVVFAGILLFVADRLLLIGIIMAFVCAISWVAVPTFRLIKYLSSEPKLERQRPRAIALTAGFAALVFGILQFLPLPYYFRAQGVVEARQWSQVLNEAPGEVEAIIATPGQPVKAGQELMRLRNPELDLEIRAARASIEETQARLRQAMQEAAANIKPLNSRMDAVKKRLERLELDRQALVLRARQDGIWVSPQVKDFKGRWLTRGSSLGILVDPSSFEFNATILQEDADRLFASPIGASQIRLPGQAKSAVDATHVRVIPGEQHILPSSALGWAGGGEIPVASDDQQGRKTLEPFFSVRADLAATTEVAMLQGRVGRIRFKLPDEPMLPRWIRNLRQLLQKRYQL